MIQSQQFQKCILSKGDHRREREQGGQLGHVQGWKEVQEPAVCQAMGTGGTLAAGRGEMAQGQVDMVRDPSLSPCKN